MIHVLRALAGVALIVPAAVGAHPATLHPAASHPAASHPAASVKRKAPSHAPAAALVPADAARRVMAWVAASGDNHGLPWAVVDKGNASLFLFDRTGKQVAAVPVLVGIAAGDEATPGVGSKRLADLGPAEKTTPAGRFLARFGMPVEGHRVLWVDYATSVALHPIPTDVGPGERRRERLLSPSPADNRITFGCINVPALFYSRLLSPMFAKKGGYVYVLPDTKPLEQVFPRLWAQDAAGTAVAG
ncbi:hypothetical protein [Sphingomonas abietis]|uniref:L,D-TPase catalytic domain-containing protein n=1 Tax=Sphingomonas abietis TaxID=3012344 RepID=A0ABY7NNW3_9SPHN|nr:hypothetical protein [Sphingomonas abietis]WBO22156.1 hypothetical protein PBT88_18705 [Sphingomonas abietis]